MKAIQIKQYSKDIKVEMNEIPVPKIGDNEVLVKVVTAAVNPLEKLIMTGEVKLIQGYEFPLTLGNELAGIVEQVGSNVTRVQKGQRVYSRLPVEKIGAFAEYVAVRADAVSVIPEYLDFEEAVAIPLTGLTAYQALNDILKVESGKTLFIPGGSGGFGQIAVPLAKAKGLKVIVSGNPKAKAHIMALGADQFIDYKTENYWEVLSNVDYVIDTLGAKEFDNELSIIKPGGQLLSLKTAPNKAFAKAKNLSKVKQILFGLVGAKYDKKASKKNVTYHFMFVDADGAQLDEVSKILAEKQVKPQIDPKEFSLKDTEAALNYTFDGHPSGKVIIKVNQ
ncbi:NADP-dependent oxidoreductase [Macrococcoides canis]|uniref:Zinc-type alcohol dehydrogenase-like protein n=1 Tax=Macrococcoides canis TaxID=1855823 RepID=A0A1W7A8V0_9STAP|nr:NADP-dependent oxidoreductase [Macrococcus canis]ARQ06039.1 Zinc-type alcohol dehydrogenase-like protein [Macrococcus canis]UTH00383.1 NADP-dependent oxidoreductase [Macrococcus canis]UTH11859.1 NADP-dependent oxidoreductase [Macrococcus canis]WBF52606.1 NADP-dependent oxidoreductase [Macrococcus canis]